jgi:hypothetical protein
MLSFLSKTHTLCTQRFIDRKIDKETITIVLALGQERNPLKLLFCLFYLIFLISKLLDKGSNFLLAGLRYPLEASRGQKLVSPEGGHHQSIATILFYALSGFRAFRFVHINKTINMPFCLTPCYQPAKSGAGQTFPLLKVFR